MKRIAARFNTARHHLEWAAHHPLARHSHHWAYVAYYVVAVVNGHGADMVICWALLGFSILHTITNEKE
jgi:hypothetical protein